MTDPEFQVRRERMEDIQALNEFAARAFGPGRFARTAHRVREYAAIVEELSHTAWVADDLAGSIRFAAIRIGERSGALLLGPLMVEAKWAGKGCGLRSVTGTMAYSAKPPEPTPVIRSPT